MNLHYRKPRRGHRVLHPGALVAALLVAACFGSPDAQARSIPWKEGHFRYVADHKDLKEVVRDLGASENVITWISPQVDGTVTGRFDETPQRFLDRMADSFGFIWYYDGSVLRVSGPNEARSATIGLTHASTGDLRRALVRLGVTDPRFPVLYDDSTGTAIVSGPPRMVELATDVAHLIDRDVARADEPEIRTFPLHYAWAMDRSLTINGQTVNLPGVASVLRSMYPDGQGANIGHPAGAARADAYKMHSLDPSAAEGGGRGASASPIPTLPGMSVTGAFDRTASNPPLPASYRSGDGSSPPGLPAEMALGDADAAGGAARSVDPVIQADARDNAILIRARAEAMPAFEKLIASLDRRPGVIEIDASIIQITETGLKELGVDWRVHSGHLDFETGNGQSAQASNPGSLNPQGFADPTSAATTTAAATPTGAVLTAVIGGAGRYLLSRISALEQTDNAHITANPKVATLDNIEAVMDNKQTFYVPVQGYQSGDLYSVSAGVSLRVLPSIIVDKTTSQIRLDVHIENGQLTTQVVGQLPVVNTSTIDTQTLVDEGQSLLIAGYTVDQDDNSTSGVPGLSKLPVIGKLFQYKQGSGQKSQLLFLITPHIISTPPDRAPTQADACSDCSAEY